MPILPVDETKERGSTAACDFAVDDELLGALTAAAAEAAQIDHTLDLLTSSVDLFDVPAWEPDSSG